MRDKEEERGEGLEIEEGEKGKTRDGVKGGNGKIIDKR